MFLMFKSVYSTYDGIDGVSDCIPVQTYRELPPVLGSVHHLFSKCFFYDVGVFAFSNWLNPEHCVQGSLTARKNCFCDQVK
jgi:hypothetical protein